MKGFVKSIIILLSLVLLLGVAYAEANDKHELSQEQQKNIIGTIDYMKLTNKEFVYIACADGVNKDAYFIYDDESMIGLYIVYDDCPAETFIVDQSDKLYEMIRNERTDVYLDEGIALKLDGEVYCFGSKNKVPFIEKDQCDVDLISATEGNNYKVSASVAYYLVGTASEGVFLQMPHVANADHPVYESGGLCWAASGASINNYYNVTTYSALSMYYKVKSLTGGIPIGIESYEKAIFTLVAHLNYTFKNGKPAYNYMKASLVNGSPIMTCFYCDADSVGHAVVMCGFLHIQNTYGYIYMDPNVSGNYVIVYQAYSYLSNSSNTIYYSTGGHIYNRMSRSYRNFSK